MNQKYYPITNILKEQLVSKINKRDDYRESFKSFSKKHQLPNTGNCEMTLSQLRTLLVGDNALCQFDIIEGKVSSFLNDTQVGFLQVNKLFDDIVVGAVLGEYDEEEYPDYQEYISNGLNQVIQVLEEDGYNEFMLTIAGRHRIVGLTTVCDILGISTDEVIISVLVKTYETWEDAALAVLCSNKSRSMTPAERTNCLVNSKGVNVKSINDLSQHASTGIKNAKESFALACTNLIDVPSLTKNTVASIAKSFITQIGKTKSGKKVISYLSDTKILNALVNVFKQMLTDISNTDFNVSRAASKVGVSLATQYLKDDATVNALIVNKMVSHEDKKQQSSEETDIVVYAPEDSF